MSPLASSRLRLALFSTLVVAGLAIAAPTKIVNAPQRVNTTPRSGISPLAPPANDECSGAAVVPGVPYTSPPVDITDATPQESNEGFHTCASAGADRTIWYSFAPSVTGQYLITTCPARGATGSTVYDTLISIHDGTGGCPLPGAGLACDDSTGCSSALPGAPYVDQATIVSDLTAGTTYYISAGHWADDAGGVAPGFENIAVHIELSPASANDNCSAPQALTLNRVTGGTTASATNDYRSQGDALCFSGIGQTPTTAAGGDVVFSFTAPAVGKYSFHYVQDDSAAALRSQNPALYLSHDCPEPAPNGPAVSCIKGANRIAANGVPNGNRSEEIDCVPLAAGELVYLYFDDRVAGNVGGPFAVEVTQCTLETEPNDAIATANSYPGCEIRGAANTAADVDFFDLGAPPAGSKVFLGVDAVAANDGDFEMRLTNATDTLGYDNDDGTSWVSANAPIIAGPFADGSELYARINRGPTSTPATASEPYRLYARIETTAAQNEIDTPSNASYFFANHVTGGGFVAGVMATQTDQDCFRFALNQGDNLVVFSDNNPARTGGTITNVWPILRNLTLGPPTASRFVGQVVRNNAAPSPGTLTGTSPSVTSNFMNYRARYTGLHMACFAPTQDVNQTENPPANAYPLAYQGSISVNCGPVTSATSRITDVSVTKVGPAGPVNTGDIIDYTITLTNDGTDIAEDVRLTDALPPELVFLGLGVDDGFGGNNVGCIAMPTPGLNDEIIDCTNFTIAPGASTAFTIQVQVGNCIGAGLDIANTASITTLSTDPNPANDSASWTFTTIETGTCSDILCDPQIGCYPNACTINDHCEAGVCVSDPVNCDDNSVCTDDSCDPTNSTGAPCIHDTHDSDYWCNDGNECTFDYCDPVLFCVFPPVPAGLPCYDFLNCTNGDACDGAGTCVGGSVCDDGLPCTDDYADENNACACGNPLSFPGTACDDGNACTQLTSCDGAGETIDHCSGGTGIGCDDGNVCTNDSCDPAIGCVHTNNTGSCDDDNPCTDDSCDAALGCVHAPHDCEEQNYCTEDTCDPSDSDGDPCIHTDITPLCEDGRDCTSDSCDPNVGCVFYPLSAGTPCNDFLNCLVGDVCNGHGECIGRSVCDDGLPCTIDFVDDVNGACVCVPELAPPTFECETGNACVTAVCDGLGGSSEHCQVNGVESCDDGNPCTSDSCDPAIGCIYSTSGCDDGNPCTDDLCDPSNGCVHTNNTAPCSDNNACSIGDTCGGGVCQGGGPRNCDDGNACTDDGCNPGFGCYHNNNSAPCDDGNVCTFFDICGGGTCQSGAGGPGICDDHNPCTDDGCNPASGCTHTNNTAPCSDGNGCTVGDTCGGGSCGSGVPVVCTASDQCHVAGTCDPGGGCSNPAALDGTTCNDGNPGTSGDACQAGVCTGGTICNPTNDPKTLGWWSSQCTSGGHSGESIDNADALCVAAYTPAFSGITTAAQVCEILSPAHGNNTPADKAEKQLMTLALNICSQRICPSQGLDASCSAATSVGQALANGSTVLVTPGHTNQQLGVVECQATEINNGRALELDTLMIGRQGSGVTLTWTAPTLDDGTGTPTKYKVWRRPMGSMAPFTQIGVTTGLTFLDTSTGTTARQYNVTSVF